MRYRARGAPRPARCRTSEERVIRRRFCLSFFLSSGCTLRSKGELCGRWVPNGVTFLELLALILQTDSHVGALARLPLVMHYGCTPVVESTGSRNFMGARILVVDDSPTIRKVVSSILERHEYVTLSASDGVEAMQVLAETEETPDLMLVDFVMPRMNGYQLCMSVQENERFRGVPVVLMSAKGDRIRGKFVSQTGALDAITKPFDARGLLAVIESALTKKSAEPEGAPAQDEFTDDEAQSSRESWGDKTGRNQSLLRVSNRLADLLGEQIAQQSGAKSVIDRGEVASAFTQALSPEVTGELASGLSEASLANDETEILSGDLASISIAEILQLLEIQKKTGALSLGHGKRRVSLILRDGDLDFAKQANLPSEFLLGRYLVDKDSITRAELEKYIAAAREASKVLGDYLVSEDILTADDLRNALVQQTSELLYEVVRWRKGRFRFTTVSDEELSGGARLGLRTAGLVMEGFRRVDEWRLIEDSFDFSDVLFRDDHAIDNLAEHQEIREEERAALDAIDGDATGEVLDKMTGSSFENCKVLYRLLNGRLVKRRTQ